MVTSNMEQIIDVRHFLVNKISINTYLHFFTFTKGLKTFNLQASEIMNTKPFLYADNNNVVAYLGCDCKLQTFIFHWIEYTETNRRMRV